MYDATYAEICALQYALARHGISKDELNLEKYAGLTFNELRSICESAIKRKERKEGESNAA